MRVYKDQVAVGIGVFLLWSVIQLSVVIVLSQLNLFVSNWVAYTVFIIVGDITLKILVGFYIGYAISKAGGGYLDAIVNIIIVLLVSVVLGSVLAVPAYLYIGDSLSTIILDLLVMYVVEAIMAVFAIAPGMTAVWLESRQRS